MSILGSLFGKKDGKSQGGCCDTRIIEDAACGCSCGGACEPAADDGAVVVKVMGTGCKKCHQLHENALMAAEHINKAVRVEYVTDIEQIAAAGVMSTPALVVDNTIVSSGRLLSVDEIEKVLK